MGDGGRSYEHGIQNCFVVGNVDGMGRPVSFVVETFDKVEDALPIWLMNKGAILVHQS